MENALKKAWRQGQPTLGAWLTIPSAVTAESMATLELDWLCIDLQHGLIDYQTALMMLQAISGRGPVPLVRVPWNEPGVIGKVLDAGAMGVIVPMVSSRQEAERAVSACRYPPRGQRSFGPTRAALVYGRRYFDTANEEILCLPMIETREGLENVDDILTVPGVDGTYVGPNDLSLALGLAPGADPQDEVFQRAIDKVISSCRRHGVVPGCAGTARVAPKRLEQGFLLVEVTRDAGSMMARAHADLESVRAQLADRG